MEYKSCYLMGHGVSIEEKIIRNCCLATPTNSETPILIKDYDPENIDWERILEVKKKLREQQKATELDGCKGCYCLETKVWSEDKYISHINFNHWKKCNSKCIYCYTRNTIPEKHDNIIESIKKLVNSEYFKNTGEITFQGGEPTILDEFEELLDLFLEKETKIRVHSSGILHSKKVEEGIKKGLVTIVISIDSGTANTYQKIKDVPCFEKVCSTIERYSKVLNESNQHLLRLKYIIVPGINDSIEEIDKWIHLIKKNNIKYAIVDVEYCYARKNTNHMPEHIFLLMDYIKFKTQEMGITFDTYDSAIYALKSRTIKEQKTLFKFKFLYKQLTNFFKRKNLASNHKYD